MRSLGWREFRGRKGREMELNAGIFGIFGGRSGRNAKNLGIFRTNWEKQEVFS